MLNDSKVWQDFISGEKYALSLIYHQHVQLLFRYGKKFTGDNELIKDSIQDLFFDLIRTRHCLKATDNIKFYLIKSFRRRLCRNMNSLGKFPRKNEDIELHAQIVYSAEDSLIDQEDISNHKVLIRRALKEINPKQREILFYRFICGFEYHQICEIMSVKYDSARKQVFRALQALREKLPEKVSISYLNQ